MFFESREAEMVDFSTPYRVSVPVQGMCNEPFIGDIIEEVNE